MLCSIGSIVVIGNGRVAAYPDSRRHFTCVIELFYLHRGDRLLSAAHTLNGLDIQLTVGNGYLDGLGSTSARQIYHLEHTFHFDSSSWRIADSYLYLIQTLGQINVKGVGRTAVVEFDGISQNAASAGTYIFNIPCLSEAISPARIIAVCS